MLTRAKMRAILLLPFLFLGLCRPTDGLCDLHYGNFINCEDLEDAKYISTYNLNSLKAPVMEKSLAPRSFVNFTTLEHLDLSGGDLEAIKPGAFSDLENLKTLSLAHNSIDYIILTALDGLDNLKSFDLRKNVISQIPPALIRLKNLQKLDISGNPLACNCATLRVRDLLVARGVKISRNTHCVSPSNLEGTPLLKPNTEIICLFEDQDDEMQRDEPADMDGSGEIGSGEGSGSEEDSDGEFYDGLYDSEYEVEAETPAPEAETPAPEVETPAPEVETPSSTTQFDSVLQTSNESEITSSTATPTTGLLSSNLSRSLLPDNDTLAELPTGQDETLVEEDSEFGFAGEGEAEGLSPATPLQSEPTKKPEIFIGGVIIPVEGSGTEETEEGSGTEGSGTDIEWPDWTDSDSEITSSTQAPMSTTGSYLDLILSSWWSTTTAPIEEEDSDLDREEEQFIDVTSEKSSVTSQETPDNEDFILTKLILPDLAVNPAEPVTPEDVSSEASASEESGVVTESPTVVEASTIDSSRSGKVLAGDGNPESSDTDIDEDGNVSPTRQPKKGMGSYVVLAALLAVLAGLIGFAAYKGDFCSRKRKRNDVERGRELKDMQKSLLDGNNSTQPKISSNGNAESAPLVVGSEPTHTWTEGGEVRPWQRQNAPTLDDKSRYAPPVADVDPVKPPRKSLPPHDEPAAGPIDEEKPVFSTFSPKDSPVVTTPPNSPTSPLPMQNPDPPLSPNAQRVKITLQENPDSVPKTPILITRTKAGENLVKTP